MAQTQTPSVYWKQGDRRDYSPASDTYAGDIVVIGTSVFLATDDIAGTTTSFNNGTQTTGGVLTRGLWKVPKDTSTFSDGDPIYWNATGNPIGGTAGTGCATSTASGNNLMGQAVQAQLTGDATVLLLASSTKRTTTLGGAVVADSLTGDASTMPIAGLAAAQGGSISVTGGASSTSANAGGAAAIAGGAPGLTGVGGAVTVTGAAGGATSGAGGAVTSTGGAGTNGNAAGGANSVIGGAGQGSAAGGAVAATGGLGGATGAGGAITVTGGAGGATSGTGGAVTMAAGAATGTTAVGGLAKVIGGASAGASGTAGGLQLDTGAAAGGTGATMLIGDVNATTIYLGRGKLQALQVGLTLTALGTNQSSTPTSAQLLGGLLSQTGATGAGTVTLPTGTALSTACLRTPVAGDTFDCEFYNLGGSQTLTITGAAGTTVIGTAAVGTGKMAKMKFYNVSANVWNIYCIVSG